MRHATVAAVIALASVSAFAQPPELPPLVRDALKSVSVGAEGWAYTQTTVDSDGKSIETFDPSRPEGQQWQLVMKDGRKPDAKELAEYAERKLKRKGRGAPRTSGEELSEMVRPGSLRLVRESASDAVYEFLLPMEGDKKDEAAKAFADAIKGRFTIAKEGPWLQVLVIELEKPIRPVVGVRIDKMYTRMTFRPPAANVPPLLGEVRMTLRGRAFMVKKLDQDSVSTYSDYRRVNGRP